MTKHPDSQPTDDADTAQIIDLPTVTAAVRKLVSWFDDLLAGKDPPIGGLNAVMKELQALPGIPGRLGRDITLIAGGGAGANRVEVVAALNRLRHVASMEPEPQPKPPAIYEERKTSRRTRRKPANPPQATLPGLASN